MLTGRDSGVSVGFISRRFMISPATVSDSLRVLAGKGLIAKSRHESDSRAVMVTITESGRAVADRCSHGTKKLLRIVEGWDESRRAEALSLVFELIAGLQEEGKDFVDRMCAACRHFAINCDIEGGPAPYYCRSFGVPLKTVELRVDCPEFEPKGT